MSYESVPCGSPESQTVVEDPAPSLYSGDDDNRFIKTIKRPQEVPESTRLADTAKIEDEIIMNEEQIARVTGRINPAPPLEPPVLTRISPRRNFCEGREVEIELRDESSRRNAVRARYLGNQWIDLNDVNPQVAEKNHSTEYVEKQNLDYDSLKGNRSKFLQERGERDGRVSAGVSVIKSSREQEVDSESDTESSSRSTKKTGLPGKEDSVSLVCNENISAEQLRDERSEIMHRPHIYNYGFSHEDSKNPRVSRVPENESSSGKDKLISGRQSVGESGEGKKVEKGEHGGTVPPVSVYYMPYSPHMASISRARQAGLISRGNASVPHAHLGGRASEQLAHLAISDGRGGYRIQQLEYRPEQQVPIANSSEENTERNVMMTGVSHNGAVQYVDRQGLFPGGFAVLPGIGTVRVMDGMFFHQPSIPLGPDGSHYENFASVSSFVPMTSLQGQTTSSPSPSVNASLTCDSNAAQPQEKSSSVAKSFTSQTQPQPVSSFPNLDDKRPISSPAVQSDRDSPAPSTDDGDNKKFSSTRQRNKQRPLGGAKSEIKCDQCGKIFGSSSALAKHKLTHSDERRYVCQICSKGFKRQDHLNGHMVTHRDKKPYECSFSDCDKSYCDMRSLRRHLENHHAALAASSNATSVTTTTGNKQTNTVTAVTVVPDVGHVEVAAGQNASRVRIKTVRGDKKDTDESSSGGGHYQAGGYDSGKSSGRSTPSAPHEIVPLRDRLISQIARERNSDSISSGTSEETGAHTGETSRGHTPETASHAESKFVAVNLLKQAAERAQEEREKQSGERFQQHPYMAYQEGFPYQQWYPAGMYSQDPRIVYQYPQGIMFPPQAYPVNSVTGIGPDVQSHQVTSHHFSGDHRDIGKSPLKSVNQLRSSPREHSSGGEGHQMPFLTHPKARIAAGTPTNPTAVAVGAAKNLGKYQFTRESYYGVHPSGTQWQQVRYDDNTAVSFATEHKQGLMGNNKSMRTHAHSESSEEIDSDNARHYGKYTLYRAAHKDDSFGTAAKRAHADQNFSSSRIDRREYEQMLALQEAQLKVKIEDNNNYENQANGPSKTSGDASGVFRNPSDILSPRRKQKPKLEPLKIPDHVSTSFQPGSPKNRSRPCTPPIYTPPPMLSPHSIFSHIARPITPRSSGIPQLPMTPSRLRLSNRSCRNSVEADEESYQFPEPKINIGSQFQAEIPEFVGRRNVCVDSHPANLVWSPMDERKRAKRDEIESYLDVACSVAVQGGGSNKEYALHILHRANGNIKEAVHDLLKRKSFFSSTDFMHGYRYEGSVKWAAKERQTFRNSFRVKGKEFSDLKKEVGTKSVHDCVEFYYLWKATHPEAVRGRTRYIDSNSDEDYEDTSSETNSNPSLFECDFPQCSAKFVSRQALNGHIRVHGGSFMKTEPRKRSRTPASSSPATSSETVPPVKKRRPAVPSLPPSNPSDPDSPLPEYPCKVCGRVFPKIKSRSAHMKTHVKRPESHDDEKNGAVIVKAH